MNDLLDWNERRSRMVERDLLGRGIRDKRVLTAMKRVPREEFVPLAYRETACADSPLPIGEGQTISQPYMVALMTEALCLKGEERVLEIGTGSGYQTAVLAEMGAQIWTIERSEGLSQRARNRLQKLGYETVHFVVADGSVGLPAYAPFDRILASGSLPEVSKKLLDQLNREGILIAPVGGRLSQELIRIVYHSDGLERESLCVCRFVPLVGECGWPS